MASGERNVTTGGNINNSIIVSGDGNAINVATGSVFKPLHQLPSPPHDFTGRAEELSELLAALDRGAIISGLQGLGGVGKTALALKLADEIKDRYPDAQFYLDLRGVSDKPLTPAEAMAHVIRAYHPTIRLPESEAELQPLYRSVLHDQRALLLMDNARDDAQVRPLIPPASCLLLVTSRRHFTLPQMTARRLGALPSEDAIALLRKVAPRITNWNSHDAEIAAACGHLPLALRAAGSLLEATLDLRPAEYARQLRDERTRLETIGAVGVDYGIEASFNLSYERLTPETASVFRQLAVFTGSFDALAEETVCEDAGHKRLSELVRLSFVEYHGEWRYQLHELARLFALSKTSKEDYFAISKLHSMYFLSTLKAAQDQFLEGGSNQNFGLNLFDGERENIIAGQTWATQHSHCSAEALVLCDEYPTSGYEILPLKLPPRERMSWLEVGISSARELQLRQHEGWHWLNLSNCYDEIGEDEHAIESLNEGIAILRDFGSKRDLANTHGQLGNGFLKVNAPDEAIRHYEQAIILFQEIEDRLEEGKTIGNLAIAQGFLGNTQTAFELNLQSLSIAREVGDHKGMGDALFRMGIANYDLKDIPNSIEHYNHALVIYRLIGYRRGESAVLESLSKAHFDLGETCQAFEFSTQALAIRRELCDWRGEGNVLFNLGLIEEKLGDLTQAIALAETSLKIFEETEDPRADKVHKQLAEWQQQS